MLQWMAEGGIFMYAILGVSVLAFAVIIERVWTLTFSYTWDSKFFYHFNKLLKNQDFVNAERMCRETGHPLARIMLTSLGDRTESPEVYESAANIGMQRLAAKISKRTGLLQMFGNVATLLGLLGTIKGLTIAFASLSAASGAEKGALLASGISTAMNTTAFGLIVAIPCIVAYTLLSNKENSILDEYGAQVESLLHYLTKARSTDDVSLNNGAHVAVEPTHRSAV